MCERYGWTPQTQTFADLGVSGFHGANRLRGALADFLRLAKDNRLAEHPVLVLESLDRFSRQEIDESEPDLLSLLKAGVAIHVKFTGQTFTKLSTVDLGDRIQILVALKAAHNYSQQLSERILSAKSRKLDRLAKGEVVNLSDSAPSWICWDKDDHKLMLNDKADIVKVIFNEYQNGKSLRAIAMQLNADKVPAFHKGHWTKGTIKYILINPASMGQYKGKDNVFPSAITKEQYTIVNCLMLRNAGKWLKKGETAPNGTSMGRRGRNASSINIFRGLIRCSDCGGSMSLSKGRSCYYYRCDSKVNGMCSNNHSVRVPSVEFAVIGGIMQMSPEELINGQDKGISIEISTLTIKRDTLTKKINALLDLAGDMDTDEIRSKIAPLKAERDNINTQITTLQNRSNTSTKAPGALSLIQTILGAPTAQIESSIDQAIEIIHDQLANPDIRMQLAQVMPDLIKQITVHGKTDVDVQFVSGAIDNDMLI